MWRWEKRRAVRRGDRHTEGLAAGADGDAGDRAERMAALAAIPAPRSLSSVFQDRLKVLHSSTACLTSRTANIYTSAAASPRPPRRGRWAARGDQQSGYSAAPPQPRTADVIEGCEKQNAASLADPQPPQTSNNRLLVPPNASPSQGPSTVALLSACTSALVLPRRQWPLLHW